MRISESPSFERELPKLPGIDLTFHRSAGPDNIVVAVSAHAEMLRRNDDMADTIDPPEKIQEILAKPVLKFTKQQP